MTGVENLKETDEHKMHEGIKQEEGKREKKQEREAKKWQKIYKKVAKLHARAFGYEK